MNNRLTQAVLVDAVVLKTNFQVSKMISDTSIIDVHAKINLYVDSSTLTYVEQLKFKLCETLNCW